MKTTILTKYHTRCIGILNLIDRANERKESAIQLLVRHSMTTARNELDLWFLGRPYGSQLHSEQWAKKTMASMDSVLARLENYYLVTLIEIHKHSVKTKTP